MLCMLFQVQAQVIRWWYGAYLWGLRESCPHPSSLGTCPDTASWNGALVSFPPHSPALPACLLSCVQLQEPVDCSTPGLPVLHYFPEFAQIHVHWVSDGIQPSHLCCSLLLLPLIFPSIMVFSNESALCIRWPKYWSISFSTSPWNEYPGLISFRMDWFDLFAVQGTLKSLLQHHSLEALILRR